MARLKRSSRVLANANHRSDGMRSLNDPLEFGSGLNLVGYNTRIAAFQQQLSEYNTMLSTLDEMAGKVKQMEEELNSYSERMLMGVRTRYGKNSLQYIQAGGKPRQPSTRRAASMTSTNPIASTTTTSSEATMNGTKVPVN